MNNRRSPIATLVAHSKAPALSGAKGVVLSHPTDTIKVGVKGKELARWAADNSFTLPAELYQTLPAGNRGLLARVGNGEIILECVASDTAALEKVEQALSRGAPGIYRIEQQSATYEIGGPRAREVLAQMCSVNFQEAPLDRIIFTRLAGVSCGVTPQRQQSGTVYRIWVDYTYAPYLWEAMAAITSELADSPK